MKLEAILLVLKLVDLKDIHFLEDHNNELQLNVTDVGGAVSRKLVNQLLVSKGVDTYEQGILKELIGNNEIVSIRKITIRLSE